MELMNVSKSQITVTEDQYIPPLLEILEEVTPKPPSEKSQFTPVSQSISQSLDQLFPEQKIEDKKLQEARKILGETANKFTKDQLKDVITEVQYLVSTWLDEYERDLLDGLTLNEFLHEKGGL